MSSLPDESARTAVPTLPPCGTWRAQVQAAQVLGGGVVQLVLQLDGDAALRFLPGQHLKVRWGRAEPRLLAIANAPRRQGSRRIELHLPPTAQPAADACGAVPPVQAEVLLEGPLGQFHWHADGDRPVVLLAVGAGIAPIKSMLEHALGEHLQRPLHLYWAAPAPEHFYLHAQAAAWAEHNDHVYYTPVLPPGVPAPGWPGRRGELLDVLAEDLPDLGAYRVYACADAALLPALQRRLVAQALADPAALHLGDALPR